MTVLDTHIAPDLDAILAGLSHLQSVRASAVARRDGVMIEHDLPREIDARKVAAIAATILGTGEFAAAELGLGTFQKIMVYGSEGTMVAVGAGEEALLLTLARGEANVGLLLLAVERGARSVADSLKGT